MADVHPVLKHLIQTEFRDLEGAAIEGQLCLTDAAINLGLGEAVKNLIPTDGGHKNSGSSVPGSSLPDPSVFTKKVRIGRVHYRTETGKTIVEIKASLEQ